jgi:hypothetical protein
MSASASAAKSSSFAMAQEVFEEGGFDAVLEMLSSRTSVMQATLPPPPPPLHHPSPAYSPVCFPSHRCRSKPRCCCGSSLRATQAPATSSPAAEYSAWCSSLRPAQAIPPPFIQFALPPLPPHSSHTSCAAAAADPRKNCAGALSSLVRHDDACALALQAGHTSPATCDAPPTPRRRPRLRGRGSVQQGQRHRQAAACSAHTTLHYTPAPHAPRHLTPPGTSRPSAALKLRCAVILRFVCKDSGGCDFCIGAGHAARLYNQFSVQTASGIVTPLVKSLFVPSGAR